LTTTEPKAGVSDPTDGRKQYHWQSGYPETARRQQLREAVFLFVMYIVSFLLLFLTCDGFIFSHLPVSEKSIECLRRYAYYSSAGLLGGVIFDMKHFYRVVARGYWNWDRIYWRIMSPFIAMGIALVVGAMIDSSIMKLAEQPIKGAAMVSIGFIAGYFADDAVSKMAEVASVIFGKSSVTKGGA